MEGDRCRVGTVELRLGVEGEGIAGWTLDGIESTDLDGLATEPATRGEGRSANHPNGAVQIDHIVVLTPSLDRSAAALEAAGIDLRRVREADVEGQPVRQGFFRLGDVILEMVEHSGVAAGPARFWGITFTVGDLDAAAELLSDRLGVPKDAVQPGRRIATVRKEAGLGLPVALITPDPKHPH